MPEPISLLEVVPYYEPAWAFGGPPKVMTEEAKELRRRGHHVTVFTTDAYQADARLPAGIVDLDGVSVHRFPNLSPRMAFERYRFQPRGMRRALRTVQADVIHLSEMRHELAILTWRAARRREIPLVVSAHGTLPRRGGWKGALRTQYDRLFVTPMVEGAAALIAQTHHEAALYSAAGADPDRVHLVPLALDPPPEPTGPIDLGVPDGARVVLFLGRIHALKGVQRLISAFARVAPRHPDVWLVVAGRDDSGGQAAAQALATELGIAHRVSFPGPIYGDRRFDAYRRADLFAITPTHYEETSLASLEAASVGTPLLLSVQAEAPFLDEYGAGRTLGATDDPAEALLDMLQDDLLALGTAAEKMIRERHCWEKVGDAIERILYGVT